MARLPGIKGENKFREILEPVAPREENVIA